MRVLAIDSSLGPTVLGAFTENKEIEIYDKELSSVSLSLNINAILDIYNFKDIFSFDAFVFTRGPGSFTGIRIALSTAKTIEFVSKKLDKDAKIYGVSSLLAVARSVSLEDYEYIASLIFGFQNKYFFAIYDSKYNLISEYMDLPPKDILEVLKDYSSIKLAVYKPALLERYIDNSIYNIEPVDYIKPKILFSLFKDGLCEEGNIKPLYVRGAPVKK